MRRAKRQSLPETDLAAAPAMVERLRGATWEELGRLAREYDEAWKHLPYGGVPKGQLPTEPDRRTVPEARDIASQAAQLVQFRLPEVEPGIDPTYAWIEAGHAPLLWANQRWRLRRCHALAAVGGRLRAAQRAVAGGL